MKHAAGWWVIAFVFVGRLAGADDFGAAVAAYEARHYSDARTRFRALPRTPANAVAVDFYLGRLALWFDDGDEALARLESAARRAPREARIQNALGDAYGLAAQQANVLLKLGWAEKCLAAYERAVALEPDNLAFRWSLLGYYLVAPAIAGGGNRKAGQQVEMIKRLDPPTGRIACATMLLAEKRYAEAFAQFDDALREQPDDFVLLYNVGRCAAVSGQQLDRGRVALQRCLQLEVPPGGEEMPTRACVHYRLANILERMGDRAGAEAEYAAAVREHLDFRPTKIVLKN